jgi:hypothetical protein
MSNDCNENVKAGFVASIDSDTSRLCNDLATRGLVPCEHNLVIWQCADSDNWGAAIETAYDKYNVEVFGESLRGALESLMQTINRVADV